MKPLVILSVEDETGQRCVDIKRGADGRFSWYECRRDPEDGHGWRYLAAPRDGYETQKAAIAAACAVVGWMAGQP